MIGKPSAGDGYALTTVVHSETVLRGFYDFHRDAGSGPILNPFPADLSRRAGRANARNPMGEWRPERVGVTARRFGGGHRAIPDDRFNELFAALSSNCDRALVAFWISTGVRASELLGVRQCDVDPGQQLITVVRKGSRAMQQVPASANVRVVTAVSGAAAGQGSSWTDSTGLVDPASALSAVDLSRRPSHVRAGQRRPRRELDTA